MINEDMEPDIHEIFKVKAQKHNSEIIAIGNTNDHIHTLVKISTQTVISEMIREFKGSSSYFINQNRGKLYWQDGYGVLSVSLSAVDTVKKYVENQKTHHMARKIMKQLETVENEI
jgi:putative transposase